MANAKSRREASITVERAQLATAAARGRELARRAIRRRAAARRQRPATAPPPSRRRTIAAAAPEIPLRTRRALAGRAERDLIIAEGDSWFDYPFNDVLSILEDDHGFDVESVARKGDTVENMAYGEGQFLAFTRLLEKVLARGRVPRAILISGGGNDIAGDEFALLLNHSLSGLPPVNDDIVRGVVNVRLRNAYTFLISGMTEIAAHYLDRQIPIVVHGYDYPVPDGRGFLGGWAWLPGPWLEPGLHQKGHLKLAANKDILKALINRFNDMLSELGRLPSFGHVRYVDLRGALANGAGYKADWANELHPTAAGFSTVAARLARSI